MQFKHPELLYALLLLLIPIIIHLFQLRRFKRVMFTNVELLKNVTIQTRKSSKIKKWLTLLTRLLLLAAIILAFAQPFSYKPNALNLKSETAIYLDNSFSMQAKGEKGELLKRSIQDLIEVIDDNNQITVYTNDKIFRNRNQKNVRDELLGIDYVSNQLNYNAAILKGKNVLSTDPSSVKNLILLSDFQQKNDVFTIEPDETVNIHLVKLEAINSNNISVDSVYISKVNAANIEITVALDHQGNSIENLAVSLFNNNNLIAKSTINDDSAKTTFTLPSNRAIDGKITIEDAGLQFDNTLYFNINNREKIKVLSINSADDSFLKRIYSKDEFAYTSVTYNQLNYNLIENQNLIIINELDNISTSLINSLKGFVNNGGYILIIPSNNISLISYNQLFNSHYKIYKPLTNVEKKITTINYSHSIFSDVFDKKITNFQYPKVNSFYPLQNRNESILKFEDGKAFLIQQGNIFAFASSVKTENSNFTNSPLIVPTLYNIGRQSLQLPKIYYVLGKENSFDVNTTLRQDDILKLKLNQTEIIPQQRTYNNRIAVTTNQIPSKSGVYDIINKTQIVKQISYNYNRIESDLNYLDLLTIKNAEVSDSIPLVLNSIKSSTNVNELWKWFTIFALLLLVIEMVILKYFK